jgi:hypothetical protein
MLNVDIFVLIPPLQAVFFFYLAGHCVLSLGAPESVFIHISTFVFPLVYFPQNDAAERAFPSLKCV